MKSVVAKTSFLGKFLQTPSSGKHYCSIGAMIALHCVFDSLKAGKG